MTRGARSVVAAVALVGLLGACGDDEAPHTLVGYELTPPTTVGDLSLPDASTGADVAFRASADHLLLTYFGYTACPDVCPTTLAGVKVALNRLEDEADRIELAMVTIDPARDTGDVLPGYVQSFIPDAVGLRTDDDAELRTVTDRFGASYEVTESAEGEIEVAHSGALYVVDDEGTIVLTWPFGVSAEDIADDLDVLLERA